VGFLGDPEVRVGVWVRVRVGVWVRVRVGVWVNNHTALLLRRRAENRRLICLGEQSHGAIIAPEGGE